MKFKAQVVARSLFYSLVALVIILTPGIVRAIAPEANIFAQLPFLQPSASEQPAVVTSANPFSLMPGGELGAPANRANTPAVRAGFTPRQERVAVNPTNYDRRMSVDIYGNPINNQPIVVIHETVGSAISAINTFRNAYANDNDQVSYHSLIKRDGTIVYLVPPEMRAYGAGNSVFNGPNGAEAVRLDPVLPPSVNNFAYHTSLESPSDGRGNSARHSGYTEAQYRSLAWIVAQTGVPANRITTHRAVDRSRSRRDPRSFDQQRFLTLLSSYTPTVPTAPTASSPQ
jgi:hypothetical protein